MWKIFTSTLNDFGLDGTDFASCTTDSGSDVNSMCLNHTNRVRIEWDWCVSHMANKACEHGFGTAADPAKSKNAAARELLQKVIKVIQRSHQSSTWRRKFEEIQVDTSDVMGYGIFHSSGVFLTPSVSRIGY